jgi:hypothetical protein
MIHMNSKNIYSSTVINKKSQPIPSDNGEWKGIFTTLKRAKDIKAINLKFVR